MSLDKEYATGKWKGEDVRFNRVFRGHRFTDEEVSSLLAGKEIPVTGLVAKNGKTYGVVGSLERQSFTNEKDEEVTFIGFKQTGFIETVPTVFCGRTITDEERTKLENGETVFLMGLTSKKGSSFNAYVRYGQDEEGKKRLLIDRFDDPPEDV